MDVGEVLRQARRRARLTQRALAERCGLPQPGIARIESGRVVPRVDTLDRLLRACGEELRAMPRIAEGVDRTLIDDLLDKTPGERARYMANASRQMAALRGKVRWR